MYQKTYWCDIIPHHNLELYTSGLFRDTSDLCDVANRINGTALRNKLYLSQRKCQVGRRSICRRNISELQAHYMELWLRFPNKTNFDTTIHTLWRNWRIRDSYAVSMHGLKKHLTHAVVARPFLYTTNCRGNIQAGPSPWRMNTGWEWLSRISDTLGMDIKEMRELRNAVLTNSEK